MAVQENIPRYGKGQPSASKRRASIGIIASRMNSPNSTCTGLMAAIHRILLDGSSSRQEFATFM